MSRPESERPQRFTIAKEETALRPNSPLLAMPMQMRKQVVDQFDLESRVEYQKNNELKSMEQRPASTELAECLSNAKLLLREGEYHLAQNLFRSALKIDTKNEIAIRGMAECAANRGHHEEAVRILKSLLDVQKSAANYKVLADQYYTLGYNADAIENYMRALNFPLAENQDLFEIYKNLGNIFLKIGDVDSAEENYNRAYTLYPDSDVLLVNFGSLAVYKGDFERALARFREAVHVNDKNYKGWIGLAMIHRKYGDSELAWANLEKALDLDPANESAIRMVCEWAMKDNEIEKAIRRVEAYLKINDQDAQISMWLAKFLYFSGRTNAALVEIERALCLEPDLSGGIEVLSVIQSDLSVKEGQIK